MSVILGVIYFTVCLAVSAVEVPSSFFICNLSEAAQGDCLKKAIQGTLPSLAKGIPSVGLPPIDPLELPSMSISEGTGAVHFTQNFKDITLSGSANTKVQSARLLKINDTVYKLEADNITPELNFKANYDFSGHILVLPIKGKGPCQIVFKNCKSRIDAIAQLVKTKTGRHLKFIDYKVKIDPADISFEFDNLFDGNEELGNEINKIMNENKFEVYRDVQDGYEKAFSLIFQSITNVIFSKVAFKDIFPH